MFGRGAFVEWRKGLVEANLFLLEYIIKHVDKEVKTVFMKVAVYTEGVGILLCLLEIL